MLLWGGCTRFFVSVLSYVHTRTCILLLLFVVVHKCIAQLQIQKTHPISVPNNMVCVRVSYMNRCTSVSVNGYMNMHLPIVLCYGIVYQPCTLFLYHTCMCYVSGTCIFLLYRECCYEVLTFHWLYIYASCVSVCSLVNCMNVHLPAVICKVDCLQQIM
jgi:hypothetical protein